MVYPCNQCVMRRSLKRRPPTHHDLGSCWTVKDWEEISGTATISISRHTFLREGSHHPLEIRDTYTQEEALKSPKITPQHQPWKIFFRSGKSHHLLVRYRPRAGAQAGFKKFLWHGTRGAKKASEYCSAVDRSWSKMTWCLKISKKKTISNQSSISAPWGIPRNLETKKINERLIKKEVTVIDLIPSSISSWNSSFKGSNLILIIGFYIGYMSWDIPGFKGWKQGCAITCPKMVGGESIAMQVHSRYYPGFGGYCKMM